jgi:hypothetical protein
MLDTNAMVQTSVSQPFLACGTLKSEKKLAAPLLGKK